MAVVAVPFWDLNFWISEDDGWVISAYPYDENDEPIGKHMCWVRIPLTSYEISKLRLGHVGNKYSSDDDFWIGLEYFLNDYHNQSDTVRVKLESLPQFIDDSVGGCIYTMDRKVVNV